MNQTGKKIVEYLLAELGQRRVQNPSYSLRAFAVDLGVEAATLSQLLKFKRKMTFEAARDLLGHCDLPAFQRNSLLLSLDQPENHHSRIAPNRVLTDSELELLADWEAFAVLSALEIYSIEHTATDIARAIGAEEKKVSELLSLFVDLKMVEKSAETYFATGVRLTTNTSSAALVRAHRAWIEKALEALTVNRSNADFSGVTLAAPKAKLDEAMRRIREFRDSLVAWLAEGDSDTVFRLNIQLFGLTPSGEGDRENDCPTGETPDGSR